MEFNQSEIATRKSNLMRNNASWQVFLQYHSILVPVLVLMVILGNTLTIVALFRFPYLRVQKNALIGSLSVSDLCVGISLVIWLVYFVIKRTSGVWDPADILVSTTVFVSYTHLIVIAVDRFLAIMMPLRYPALVTKRVMAAMIGISWGLSPILLLPLYVYNYVSIASVGNDHQMNKTHELTGIAVYATFSLTLCVLYGKILNEARAQAQKVNHWATKLPNPGLQDQRTRTSKDKGTRMVMAILFSCLILNFFYFLQFILNFISDEPNLGVMILEYVGQQCLVANAAVNVLVYAVFSKDFRKAYRTMLCCCLATHTNNIQSW